MLEKSNHLKRFSLTSQRFHDTFGTMIPAERETHYEEEDKEGKVPLFFHGSSSAILPLDEYKLLPPAATGVLSESGRRKNLDRVFFTRDLGLAAIYAAKAVKRFGGRRVIRRVVVPSGDVSCLSNRKGATVFHAPQAWLDREEEV